MERRNDDRMDNFAERIARLEQDQRHAPPIDDLKRIHSRLDDASRGWPHCRGSLRRYPDAGFDPRSPDEPQEHPMSFQTAVA